MLGYYFEELEEYGYYTEELKYHEETNKKKNN